LPAAEDLGNVKPAAIFSGSSCRRGSKTNYTGRKNWVGECSEDSRAGANLISALVGDGRIILKLVIVRVV